MTENKAGFRFDIYERIHLPDEKPAIGELEQIELLPFVRGLPGAEQTQLKGYLQLITVYAPPDAGGTKQSYEHRIPVEISLPVRASSDNEQVQVQIDQFDIELVSNRSLNLTGVLSLTGWSPELTAEAGGEGDEIVAIHEARASQPASEPIQVVTDTTSPIEQSDVQPSIEVIAPQQEDPTAVWNPIEMTNEGSLIQSDTLEEDWLREPDAARETAIETNEPKIAFKPQSQEAVTDLADTSPSTEKKSNNELEWQKLFFGGGDEQPFRKMKLCIVQKEETIQTIAERYQMNAREIALYNRLGDSDVAEGQIIYIPSH